MPAKVAIITRTKNRPLLLKRAAKSVAQQSYQNYLWVIVNDGGDEGEVRSVLNSCEVSQDRIRLINNTSSVGMEAASNIGVRNSESEFILIHDDDDTLHRSFLEKTVCFLESQEGKRFGGVTTHVEYISEEISGNDIIIHNRQPYLDWVNSIDIAELFAQNIITTISFLYRRELFKLAGGYREDLPVLGDWYFNIRFLMHADVKVLPEVLAYYHHRDRGSDKSGGNYANSIICAHEKHLEFSAICRNMLIREQLQQGGLSAAIMMGYFANELRQSPRGLVRQRTGKSLTGVAEANHIAELDRLWLLSLVLHEKAHGQSGFRKKIPRVDKNLQLQPLVQIAAYHKIVIQPPANFDEAAYLDIYPDVAKAVSEGILQCGYQHYVLNGHLEGRVRPHKD